VQFWTTESLSEIRLPMLGCMSGEAAIKKKTRAASTTLLLTSVGGLHLMIFVAFIDSGDLFLKLYV